MTEFPRSFFKNDPVMRKLYEIIKQNHRVAEHTRRNLLANRHVKGFAEHARHFWVIPKGGNSLYIHYDVWSQYEHAQGARVRIESIGVYDNFIEYDIARQRELHAANQKDIPNIN